jgi:ribonuclease HII
MIGIDEVGRGSWAGPLLVCAVRLKKTVHGLKDSKQLSHKNRKELSGVIADNADVGFGWVCAGGIDDIGLSEALKLGASLALDELSPDPDEEIIIDGSVNFVPELNSKAVIKADEAVSAVSAASIIAKVKRDEFMIELSKKYKGYGFESHVGYGTKQHKTAINKLGFTKEHRRSYKLNLKV